MGPGGYTGWVYRGVPSRHEDGHPQEQFPAERAPEAPQGLEWVGNCSPRPSGSWNPPFGPGRSSQLALPGSRTLLEQVPHNAVQTVKTAQNSVKVHTVSQNR